jgi:hypothetical protein
VFPAQVSKNEFQFIAGPIVATINMRPLYLLILTIFTSISLNAQTGSPDDIAPYDYDTTLKGGYTISFKVDDSLQYLYLKKGNRTITELASTSRGMLYKNLGYVGADFTDYFVFVQSFGSGNPHYIELIKKATGKNVLKDAAAWIDVDERKGFLLYSDKDVPRQKDKMTLYNIDAGQRQYFSFPADIFDGPEVLNRIQIHKLSASQLVIRYETGKGSRTKVYNR